MECDQTLANRVRRALRSEGQVHEKWMLGGVAFLVNGRICCGVTGNRLLVRVGRSGYRSALREPGTSPVHLTGRALEGLVYVDRPDMPMQELNGWISRGLDCVSRLPPKWMLQPRSTRVA